MAEAAEEALIKIEAVLPEEEQRAASSVHVHALQAAGLDDETRERLDHLEVAANDRRRLDICYRTEDGTESERVIRPLGIWFWGKVWTLVAWCEMRNAFRMFRVDRMYNIEDCGPFWHEPGKRLTDFFVEERCRSHTE